MPAAWRRCPDASSATPVRGSSSSSNSYEYSSGRSASGIRGSGKRVNTPPLDQPLSVRTSLYCSLSEKSPNGLRRVPEHAEAADGLHRAVLGPQDHRAARRLLPAGERRAVEEPLLGRRSGVDLPRAAVDAVLRAVEPRAVAPSVVQRHAHRPGRALRDRVDGRGRRIGVDRQLEVSRLLRVADLVDRAVLDDVAAGLRDRDRPVVRLPLPRGPSRYSVVATPEPAAPSVCIQRDRGRRRVPPELAVGRVLRHLRCRSAGPPGPRSRRGTSRSGRRSARPSRPRS